MSDRLEHILDPLPQQLELFAEDFGNLFTAYCKLRSELDHYRAKAAESEDKTVAGLPVLPERKNIGLMIADAGENIVAINQAFSALTGFREEEISGRHPGIVIAALPGREATFPRWQDLATGESWHGEVASRCKDGKIERTWVFITALRSRHDAVSHYAAVYLDPSEAPARLGFDGANLDPLTGLPNRSICLDRLQHLISQSHRHHLLLGVLYIDIDGFKEVNDSYGHATGDHLLLEISWRILSAVRGSDTLARLGGDEFVVIASSLAQKGDFVTIAAKINALLAEPFTIDGHELCIGASIGIAIHPEHGETAATLLRQADLAMYQAKTRGKNGYRIFDEELRRKSTDLVLMESGLRGAMARQELSMEYQPIVRCRDGTLVGLEALLRWHWEGSGPVNPEQFIPLAEKTGLIAGLEEWAFQTALRQIAQWDKEGMPPLRLSINLSSRHWGRADLVETLLSNAAECGIAPNRIQLEIPEQRLMESAPARLEALARLRDQGIGIAADHFGTSLSSARRIRSLPVDRVKIDRSFILEARTSADARAIVSASIAMAKALHLEVSAVGIEDSRQQRFLDELGCNEAQGNLYGAPMPPAQLVQRLADYQAGTVWHTAPPEYLDSHIRNPPSEIARD